MIDRRSMLAGTAALAASPVLARTSAPRPLDPVFPQGFLWGASTAGHQVEGNNLNADLWPVEHATPSVFRTPSGDAANSLDLWEQDLDLAKAIGLNAYRFGLEWSRIEPEQGQFSQAMIDHYGRIIAGCHARGLTPIVTYNHYTTPRWFAARGGWLGADSAALFARFAETVTRRIGDGIAMAITLNEPNILPVLRTILPPPVWDIQAATLAATARSLGLPRYICANVARLEDVDGIVAGQVAGHKAARAAIKSVRGNLPVGLSLSVFDDQAVGKNSIRDKMRQELYGPFLGLVREDDFVGVQNYERVMWGDKGRLPPPPGAVLNGAGVEVYAPSLAGAVRYIHAETGRKILVSEHGVNTPDDRIRAAFISAALPELKRAMDDGVQVLGYCHWSLIDNFEWIFGYGPKLGLASFDPVTFVRTPKPSAAVLGAIARANRLPS
ncbi:family 1 glycosylhydrolase [Novosphingobium sp.]|uniref:family 1 glycosylhydrolase n=1 Tax=Novosphingobium sp. TaxID=1874826 RepID=UPI0038BB6508